MYSFLDRVDISSLKKILKRNFFSNLNEKSDLHARNLIYNMLFSLYSYDLLYEKNIRILLLETLPLKSLTQLCKEFNAVSYQNINDTAISLSNIPWRVGSKFAWSFAEEFDIPLEYLPTRVKKCDQIELIEPFDNPPNLFEYQLDIIEKIFYFLKNRSNKAALIQLPTGAGKTRTAVESIIKYLNIESSNIKFKGVIWLGHTEELCEQAFESFQQIWRAKGKEETRIARFWGDYTPAHQEICGSIIVAGYVKLINLYKNNYERLQKLFEHNRVMVIDEAHRGFAPQINELILNFKNCEHSKIIGLTATPGRSANKQAENIQLASLFENNLISSNIFKNNPFLELQKMGVLSAVKHISLNTSSTLCLEDTYKNELLYEDIPLSVLNNLASDSNRNKLIVDCVENEINSGNLTLVFACSVRHSKELSAKLSARGYRSTSIDCRMRRNLRHRIIQEFRENKIDAIFNYGVLSTGFDAPNIKTVVIARPTTSIVLYSQMIGRGIRGTLVGGTGECRVVDIKDNVSNFGQVEEVYRYFDSYWK